MGSRDATHACATRRREKVGLGAALALVVTALAPGACNVLLDLGDHRPYPDAASSASSTGDGPGGAGMTGGPTSGNGGAVSSGTGGGGGLCSAPVAIATGQAGPTAISVTTASVFWITEGTGEGDYSIWKTPKVKGSTPPELVASGLAHAVQTRVAQDFIFYTNDFNAVGVPPGVYRIPKATGAGGSGGSGEVPSEVVDADGYGAEQLVLKGALYSLAPDAAGTTVRIRLSKSVLANQTGGCYPYVGGPIQAFTADLDVVYFADPVANAIMKVPHVCIAQAPVLFAANQVGVRVMALVPSTMIFWATADAVMGLDAAGGTPKIIADQQTDIVDVEAAPDGSWVAFLRGDGLVMRADARGAGPPVVIAEAQGEPSHLRVDDVGSVFWTNHASGEIMRADCLP